MCQCRILRNLYAKIQAKKICSLSRVFSLMALEQQKQNDYDLPYDISVMFCLVVWVFYSRRLNRIFILQEGALRIIYRDYDSSVRDLLIYSCQPSVTLLYPMKMLEKLWFSNVFRGYSNGPLAKMGSPVKLTQINTFMLHFYIP